MEYPKCYKYQNELLNVVVKITYNVRIDIWFLRKTRKLNNSYSSQTVKYTSGDWEAFIVESCLKIFE